MNEAVKQRKSRIIDTLKTRILTLELKPGSDLDEVQLCDEYSLSRTPLREIFRLLAGEGYVQLRENRGARVSEMSYTTLRDFFISAPMIYGAILELAAENATADQVAKLKLAQKSFKAALKNGSSAERAIANNRFHEITGEMADNIYLLPSFNRLLIDHARIGMTFYRPKDKGMIKNLSTANHQHDEIIKAIEAGDSEKSRQLAIEHWNLSRGQIELFVTPSSMDLPLGTAPQKQNQV